MDTPEKRRRLYAWQALAAAFVGDVKGTKEYQQLALREDAKTAPEDSQK